LDTLDGAGRSDAGGRGDPGDPEDPDPERHDGPLSRPRSPEAPEEGFGPTAQLGAVRLSDPEVRHLVRVHDVLRHLEPGHPLVGQPPAARGYLHLPVGDHEGHYPRSEAVVGPTHHHGLADARMLLEHPPDFGRRDVLALPDD
jgi:hypothetical protein